ncbi:MAG: UvrD-helicase domain-containing protein [Gammaproteobacteria bacterium]|nr:UvrD-helicase domain-containing protein [Gammaproteobacteria bacterium]
MNLQHLNEPQRLAVKTVEKPCLVLAGAGSGKTRVITQKIAWLIRQEGYKASQIRAVTFTNKAAREMKQRAVELLDKTEAKGLRISTFHTLGLNILQREYAHLGYRKGFSILDAKDAEDCIAELQHKDNPETELVKQTQHQISQWKNEFILPEQAINQAEDALQQHHARIYQAYQQQLQACNSVDFDDLIMLPVLLFRQHQEILNQWQDRIHYLLIDEYQDTNTSQYELIKLICAMRHKLTVVGDDDQSIYAWRGAKPENIQRLQQDFNNLSVVKLEQNYRSTGRILKVANQLIAHNQHLFEKKLWSASGPGEFIRIQPCKNEQDEAQKVVIDIVGKHFQNGNSYRDFAILYRGNHQSRLYEKVLREHSVPYQVTGGTAFFERSEIKDLTAYLRIIANPEDDRALLRIINTPRREIGATTIKTLGEYASWRHQHLGAVLHEAGLEEKLSRKGWYSLQRFSDWLDEKRREAEQVDAMTLVRTLISNLHYADWLRNTSSSQKQADARMDNVEELISWIGNLQKQQDDPTLDKLVSQLTLMSILENSDDDQTANGVQLMTFHAAKGLEFPYVYLVGFEEDSIPHFQCQDEQGIEEERRLAYVGITRAEKALSISYAQTRQKYGEVIQCEPSRFITEMPADELEGAEHGHSNLSEAEKKERGMDNLASLKALLSS